MPDFTLPMDELRKHVDSGRRLEEILQPASEAIESGARFVVADARGPGQNAELTTLEQLEEWAGNLDPIRKLPKNDSRYFVFKSRQLITEAENLDVSGGHRPLIEKRVMGGPPIRARGRAEPTIITFDCAGMLQTDGNYTLLNHKSEGTGFAIEQANFRNGRTYVRAIKLG